mgnify:CR=1 FL=1
MVSKEEELLLKKVGLTNLHSLLSYLELKVQSEINKLEKVEPDNLKYSQGKIKGMRMIVSDINSLRKTKKVLDK